MGERGSATKELKTYAFTLAGRGLFRDAAWTAEFGERGLRRLSVTEPTRAKSVHGDGRSDARLDALKKVLRARLAGRDKPMDFSAFDLEGAPDFHYRVWKAMHKIPFGEVQTYGEVAIEAGSPMASRACGQACGSNRIILLIPCHRVVSSTGIGGFGCGLHWKKALLELEGFDASALKSNR